MAASTRAGGKSNPFKDAEERRRYDRERKRMLRAQEAGRRWRSGPAEGCLGRGGVAGRGRQDYQAGDATPTTSGCSILESDSFYQATSSREGGRSPEGGANFTVLGP